MDNAVIAALGEPSRLRIVELLDAAPRPVGEIATVLAMRQPQVTKHLQALQRVGLVQVHPLGTRRIYSLERRALQELRDWVTALADRRPTEDVLAAYQQAVAREPAVPAAPDEVRVVDLRRRLPAPPETVWSAWTTPEIVRSWWVPEHFTMAACRLEVRPGGRLEVEYAEGDGRRHVALGRFEAVEAPYELDFELSPRRPDGSRLLRSDHRLRLQPDGLGTALTLQVRVSGWRAEAVPALAGVEVGWNQLLDQLEQWTSTVPG